MNSILYENQEQNNTKWIAHYISNAWDSCLLVYSVFKQREYLYFVDSDGTLRRINIKLKKLETCYYQSS